jgi:hypothetical protein
MSHTNEVAIILGRPDYDWPLMEPAESGGGMAVSGRDSLSYLWRFEGERASLFAVEHGAVGRLLGAVRLGPVGVGGVAERSASLREAQSRMRGVQTAYVQLCETLLSMAGDEKRGALVERLHAMRERLGDELLMFTDPADDGAHAEFRLVPEVIGIDGVARSDEERARLRPLAVALLKGHGRALGVEDSEALLGLAG